MSLRCSAEGRFARSPASVRKYGNDDATRERPNYRGVLRKTATFLRNITRDMRTLSRPV